MNEEEALILAIGGIVISTIFCETILKINK